MATLQSPLHLEDISWHIYSRDRQPHFPCGWMADFSTFRHLKAHTSILHAHVHILSIGHYTLMPTLS